MLYRVRRDSMTEAADLRGMFAGESLFLVAPGPSLRDANLELLRQRGIVTLGLNTSYVTLRPTIWLGVDYPECYPLLVYQDPGVMKISRASIAHIRWRGRLLCDYPNMHFLHLTRTSRPDDRPLFSEPARWYPKSFILAVELAWWLGFTRVYTVGTGFRITSGRQYAHGNPLSRRFVNTNKRVYAKALTILKGILPDLADRGVEIVNTTPRSRLDFVPQMALSDAVFVALAGKQRDMYGDVLVHSMDVQRRKRPRKDAEPPAVDAGAGALALQATFLAGRTEG